MLKNLKSWVDTRVSEDRRAARRRRGMTLMEVMIVIAIVVLLMGVLAFGVMGAVGTAQSGMAEVMIGKIDQKVKLYKIRKKKLPDSLEDVYKGEEMPADPWGNPFKFVKGGDAAGYDIVSYGADGKEGGTGSDADLKLSELGK